MRFSNFLTVSALLTGALGAPAVRHKHEKRDVVTATVHAQVTVVVSGNSGETVVPVNENAVVATTSSTAVASQATTSTLEPTTSANVITSQQQTSTLQSSEAASTVGSSTSSSPPQLHLQLHPPLHLVSQPPVLRVLLTVLTMMMGPVNLLLKSPQI
ncbi:ALI_collapsed_G0018390.mRNA.1.CDS.1 [Saccharomyces cerevisiae]|nr:ALI_collapsed_G0018390.mRNA.1.CDS.1 [Saccharomyces cerevisiae]